MSALLVFLGGGLGATLRHGVNIAARHLVGVDFPWGTLAINVVGSLLMGVVVATVEVGTPGRLFLATGVLGGFTTFSAFSLEAVQLFERGQPAAALAYAGLSVALALGALAAGLLLARPGT